MTNNLIVWAQARHVRLDPEDIVFVNGGPTIDGMPADDWLEAMTEEKPPAFSPPKEGQS